MNRLIICALAVVSLNSFGAAGPELALAQQSQGATKSDALQRLDLLQRLITVTQGPSKMPFSLAFRSTEGKKVYACLVASQKLHDSISSDAAQVLVDALPVEGMKSLIYDYSGWDGREARLKARSESYLICNNIVYNKIVEGVVSKEILKDALVVFYVVFRTKVGFANAAFCGAYTFGCSHLAQEMHGLFGKPTKLKYEKHDLDVMLSYDVCKEYFPEPVDDACLIL